MTKCQALRADGKPCSVRALSDGYCWAHSPSTADRRRSAYARGGRNRSTAARVTKLVPRDLRPLLDELLSAVGEVHGGSLLPARATAMASLAGAAVKIFETCELTERLEKLEGIFDDQAG